MRLFKINTLAAAILFCLSTGCLQGVGPASTSPAASSTVLETPPPDDFTVKAGSAAAAQEGIRPKPDQVSLGGGKNRSMRVSYGRDSSQLTLLDGVGTFEIDMGPTPLILHVERVEEGAENWVDAPIGQKLRLYSATTVAGTGEENTEASYCDTAVTVTEGDPPQNISVNKLPLEGGTLALVAYENSFIPTYDCADGWTKLDSPDTTLDVDPSNSFNLGVLQLKRPLPAQRSQFQQPPPSSGPAEKLVPSQPLNSSILQGVRRKNP